MFGRVTSHRVRYRRGIEIKYIIARGSDSKLSSEDDLWIFFPYVFYDIYTTLWYLSWALYFFFYYYYSLFFFLTTAEPGYYYYYSKRIASCEENIWNWFVWSAAILYIYHVFPLYRERWPLVRRWRHRGVLMIHRCAHLTKKPFSSSNLVSKIIYNVSDPFVVRRRVACLIISFVHLKIKTICTQAKVDVTIIMKSIQ